MERVLYKKLVKVCIFLSACVFLSACSPKLNWRVVHSPEQGYSALFPGKPEKIDRQIPFQNQELKQTLEAIKVDDDIYSVSSIQLGRNQAVLGEEIVSQLQDGLFQRAQSSGGFVTEENACQLRIIFLSLRLAARLCKP
jgi:hypothetical protein